MEGVIPRHVAIIPDGNRRWARQRSMKPWEGHIKAGAYENLTALFDDAKRQGIRYMSFWGFSTENWKRDKKEVEIIMRLILKGLNEFYDKAEKEKIRFLHIGRKDRLLPKLVERIRTLEEKTKQYDQFYVLLCLDYGGRDELMRSVNAMIARGKKIGKEEDFAQFLDTDGLPDPDLIIRTGGEMRMSGFMPFQSVYAELYFTKTYFPDFGVKELRKAVKVFAERQRRYGE